MQEEINPPPFKYSATNATSRAVEFPLPSTLQQGATVDSQRYEFNTNQANSRAFVVQGLLSAAECDYLIDTTERLGYAAHDDIPYEYPKDYRNNQRMIYISSTMAGTLWKRLQKHLTMEDVANVTPVGFCSEGIWVPVALNDGIIFSKYSPGQFFKPHKDGLYINKNEEYSIFSVVVYLNETCPEGTQGGNLRFIDPNNHERVTATFRPTKGTAIIFNSDAYHEGETLVHGCKYILRTFVMFRNIYPTPKSAMTEDQREAVNLFSHIEHYFHTGEVRKFQDMYLKAQSIQLAHSGTIHGESKLPFPMDVFRKIFAHLEIYEIRQLGVNRAWLRATRDNETWKTHYLRDFAASGQTAVPGECYDYCSLYQETYEEAMGRRGCVLVLGDVATFLKGCMCEQRVAACELHYSGWDGSMLEPTPLSREDDLSWTGYPGWFDETRLRMESEKQTHTFYYFSNLATQRVLSDRQSQLMVVTFPLLWGSYTKPEENNKVYTVPDSKNDYHSLSNPIDECYYDDYALDIFEFDTSIVRISRLSLDRLQATNRRLTEALEYCQYDQFRPFISYDFLDASVAAAYACDVKKARVLLFQALYSTKIVQLTDIVGGRIVKDQILPNDDQLHKTLLTSIADLNNNLIMVSDCDRSGPLKQEADKLFTAVKEMLATRSTEQVNVWTPNHVDLYYGAKKYMLPRKADYTAFPLSLRGAVKMPDHVEYIKYEDEKFFEKSGKTFNSSY